MDTLFTFEPIVIAANAEPSEWMKVSPYGEFAHPLGLQRFGRAEAETLANNFNGIFERSLRLFGGAPIYIGHPDDASFAGKFGHTDTRAYAWANALAAREDGLYARIKWSPEGRTLLANAHYKYFSPRWTVRPVPGTTNPRVIAPDGLVSIGLTNNPNIPGDAIANSFSSTQNHNPDNTMNELLLKLLPVLGFADATAEKLPDEQSVLAAANALITAANTAKAELAAANDRLKKADADLTAANAETARIKQEKADLTASNETALFNLKRQLAGAHVAHAVSKGIVKPTEQEAEVTTLANAQDIATSATALLARPPSMKVVPITGGLGTVAANAQQAVVAFREKVEQTMANSKVDYNTAWVNTKRDYADLYKLAYGN